MSEMTANNFFSIYSTDLSPRSGMAQEHFLNLVGSIAEYYGADSGDNTFKIDGIVFKILEDPDDGYRSLLGAIDYTADHSSIFFQTPLAKVKIDTYYGEGGADGFLVNKGYRLIDIEDEHVWLEFGTDNYDDYYPVFIFRHFPKPAPGM